MEELLRWRLAQITTVKTWFREFVTEAKREGL